MSTIFFYTLFYILMSGCIVYPPTEFVSAGLTVKDIFANWMGNENEHFVQHHIRRSIATLFVHSILPLGYFIGLRSYIDIPTLAKNYENLSLLICFVCSIIAPLYVLYKILKWSANDWAQHPIAQNLSVYCENNAPWTSVASDINTEYRRIDKVIINCSTINRIIVTDNWIIKITPYRILVGHQNDTVLIVTKTDTHDMSPTTRGEVQFINIQVKPTMAGAESFDIRLNFLDFNDLQDKVTRPIILLQNVTFHKTLSERFIDAFKDQVKENPYYDVDKDLELCIGCMQVPSNVKLTKLCANNSENQDSGECRMCNCRPMWCIDCMAKWFLSRQDDSVPETWLSSKCTCPMCRATFCLLDVCLTQKV